MNILMFELLAYGITNILVFGSIFKEWRAFWDRTSPNFFGKLFTCPLCLSTWVGAFLSTLFIFLGYTTPFISYGITMLPLVVFFDACFTSGCVWIIHTVQEYFEK
jgi:hypothetical protein